MCKVPFESLPIEAQLNVECDNHAKDCMQTYDENGERAKPTEGSRTAQYLGTHLVTTEMYEQIQNALTGTVRISPTQI